MKTETEFITNSSTLDPYLLIRKNCSGSTREGAMTELPSEMTERSQWVLWKRDTAKGKVPYQVSGKHASSTGEDTWNSLDAVLSHADKFDGIGFVFTENDPLIFIDLDHVIDTTTSDFKKECEWARELFIEIDSYTEISPSGDGLHIYCKGSLTKNRKKKCSFDGGSALEVYTTGRFSTVTGKLFGDTDMIKVCDLKILEKYLQKEVPTPLPPNIGNSLDPLFIMSRLISSNKWEYSNPDQSSADQSLANNIVFYTGDYIELFKEVWGLHPSYDLIERKNNPDDYIARTFQSALKGCRNFYDSNYKKNSPDSQYEDTNRLKRASILTKNITAPKWLIKPYIPEEGLIEIIGESGSYKSFIVLDMLFCVSAGIEYHSFRAERGMVVYIAGEGSNGVTSRLKALELHYSVAEYDFYVLPMPSNLMESNEVERLSKEIKAIASNGVAITIFDTLHRNSAGSDENSSKDFAMILGHIDTHIKPLSKVVGWVHHTGLSSEAKGRGRGTSSRYGAMDTVMLIEKLEEYRVVVKCTKQKDSDQFLNTLFELKKVSIGVKDEDNNEIVSLVPMRIEGTTNQQKRNLKKEHYELVTCLRLVISKSGRALPDELKAREHIFDGRGISIAEWRKEAVKIIVSSGDDDPKKVADAKNKAFGRAKKILIEERLIGEYENMVWVLGDCLNTAQAITTSTLSHTLL